MKLHTKITLFSVITTWCIVIAAFIGIDYFYKQLTYTTEYEQLQERADEFASIISKLPSAEGLDNIAQAYVPMNGGLRILDANKTYLTLQSTDLQQALPFDAITYNKDMKTWEDVPTIAYQYAIIWPDTHEVVSLQLIQTLPDVARNMTLLRWILALMALFAIIPIYFISRLLAYFIVNPIKRLTNTMKHNIDSASYETIAPPTFSKDEIAQMTYTYNELMAQLKQHYEQQQQFVGNASHELRTPLTVIDSYVQLLQRRGVQNEALTLEAVDAIARQSRSMKVMMEQMLQLASAYENVPVERASLSLQSLFKELQVTMRQAYECDVSIDAKQTVVQTDEPKLKQLLFIF